MGQAQDEQIRLSRLNIFLFEFRQARKFADYILNKKLHDVKGPQAKARLVHLAFNTSLIVSYSRPFHMSNEGERLPRVSLRQQVASVLDDAESLLHARVIDKRDQAVAHSDAMAHEFEGLDYDGTTVLFYKSAFDPLTKDETRMLRGMVRKWISHLDELRSTAKQSRRSGQKGFNSLTANL
jgi:hypothetical protein